jgi:hypothetical protein
MRRFWLIEFHEYPDVKYRRAFPAHYFSDDQMDTLLRTLAAKTSLSLDEIAMALCRKNYRSSHLAGHRSSKPFCLSNGPMMDWTARVFDENDSRLSGLLDEWSPRARSRKKGSDQRCSVT